MTEIKFSIVIPVFNRPDEIDELLRSLSAQEYRNFEVIIIEDGSDRECKEQVDEYSDKLKLQYFVKPNTGPGDSRNYGANKANGEYLIFFDSDCIIPSNYLTIVNSYLSKTKLDLYGGPDRAHHEFSYVQQAINYAMTSFLTTGGIRGHRKAAGNFQPRSFNMGINRTAFNASGGFSNMHPGEDPDLVYRIIDLGFSKGLIVDAFVYHKRRINLKKFSSQIYKFGLVRTILMKRYPSSKKLVFWLPSIALLLITVSLFLGWKYSILWYLILSGVIFIFIDSLLKTGNLITGILAVIASGVQVASYGWGFIKGWWFLHLLGKQAERKFPQMFPGSKGENR